MLGTYISHIPVNLGKASAYSPASIASSIYNFHTPTSVVSLGSIRIEKSFWLGILPRNGCELAKA